MTGPLALTSRHSAMRDLKISGGAILSRPVHEAVLAQPSGPAFRALQAELALRFEAARAEIGLPPERGREPVFTAPSLLPLPPVQEAAMEAFTGAHDALRQPTGHGRHRRRLRLLRHGTS